MNFQVLMTEMTKNILLVLGSIFVALLCIELGLRISGIGSYSAYDRVLFYTAPSFVVGDDNAVKYAPNTKIRSAAVYGDFIDYDVTNTTNNLGLYDEIDYDGGSASLRDIVFVGDSFTAGSGSDFPWVTRIRKSLNASDSEFYNLGVGGAGVYHFYNLLKSFEKKVSFDEVNIMVISNDFFRTFWYPYVQGDGMWFCRSENDCLNAEKRFPVISIIEGHETSAELIERAQTIYRQKRKLAGGEIKFYQKMRVFNLFCDYYSSFNSYNSFCPHLKSYSAPVYTKDIVYRDSLSMIRKIKTEFTEVKFRLFHIPEKGEVGAERYSLDIKDDIKGLGIEYVPLLQSCDWNISMYHKHDKHPNDSGYKNLAGCMKKYFRVE